jgi:hypothetical protein
MIAFGPQMVRKCPFVRGLFAVHSQIRWAEIRHFAALSPVYTEKAGGS